MSPPPLRARDVYHTGIVVPDLEKHQERMSRLAGYRWTGIQSAELPVRLATGVRTIRLRYAYSLDAPAIELVQEVPGTPWTATPAGAVHHLGFFCDDLAATTRRLVDDGYAVEAAALVDGEPAIFAYFLDPAGVRVEVVDRTIIPDFAEYLRVRAAT